MADHGAFNSFLTMPGPHPSSSAQTWELHKPTIRKLYVEKWHTLQKVMEIMERDHNFRASKKVYRKRLAKWGFERNMKGTEREAILRKWIERGAIGKHSKFTLRGRTTLWGSMYTSRVIQKFIQKMASQESSGGATPPHLRCSTPEPDSHDVIESAAFLRRYAKNMEAYKLLRSNGVGTSTNAGQLQDNFLQDSVADHGDAGVHARAELPRTQMSSDAYSAMA